ERIAEELRKLLVHPRRARGLELLREFGLLEPILPELVPTIGLPQGPPATPTGDLWGHVVRVMDVLDGPTWPPSGSLPPGGGGSGWGGASPPPQPSPIQGEGEKRPVSFPLAFAALLHDVGKPGTVGRTPDRYTFHNPEHLG